MYTWGNQRRRNILTNPCTWNFNASLHREFHPLERITSQFRLETFDATNTVHPNNPGSQLDSPNFGVIKTVDGSIQPQVRFPAVAAGRELRSISDRVR
jgi:hypothetical protein